MTANSGKEVPKATNESPTIAVGISYVAARPVAPSRRKIAPCQIITPPAIVANIASSILSGSQVSSGSSASAFPLEER